MRSGHTSASTVWEKTPATTSISSLPRRCGRCCRGGRIRTVETSRSQTERSNQAELHPVNPIIRVSPRFPVRSHSRISRWEDRKVFAAWGRFVYRHRWPVLAVSLLLLLASAFIASQGGKLESGGFIETAESGRASRLIEQELPIVGGSTFTLIFSSDTLSAKETDCRAGVGAALVPLRTDPRVDTIITPYDASVLDPTRSTSKDGHAIAVDAAVKGTIYVARGSYPALRADI